MERVWVVGNAGSGKTTFARTLAGRLQVRHVELDSIFHQPGWTPLDRDEFRRRVSEIAAGPSWVVDGNYSAVSDLLVERADTVIWLDPPRTKVMRQMVGRTLRRTITRQTLWNGNREPIRGLYARRPEDNLIVWAWTKHHDYQKRFTLLGVDVTGRGLAFHRLRSRSELTAFVDHLT